MSLTNSIITRASFDLLKQTLLFGPQEKHFQQAEQAWKALSFWRKIKSKKKYIRKKAMELYQAENSLRSQETIGTTITIRKPKRYETI